MGEIPMRRRISRILIGAALCACLICSGCSEKIREGEIYEKEYKPEKTIVNIVPIIHTNGKTASTTCIPMIYHYPDRWCVRIRSFEKNEDGKYETAQYYTTKEVYDKCRIGDIFSFEEDRDLENEPVEKKRK